MGRIAARFLADTDETVNAYSISEWWLEPNCSGPGAHSHPEDDVFFVLEGTGRICGSRRGTPLAGSPGG